MFIDKTKFKKAVNTAYKKEGLTVSNDGDGIIICGGGVWVIWMRENRLPKTIKAILIELIGELPGPGEEYNTAKEDMDPWEPYDGKFRFLRENQEEQELYKSKIVLDMPRGPYRVYKQEDGKVMAVREEIVKMVSIKDLEDCEYYPDNPGKLGKGAIWRNDRCILWVAKMDAKGGKTEELFKLLEKLELQDER